MYGRGWCTVWRRLIYCMAVGETRFCMAEVRFYMAEASHGGRDSLPLCVHLFLGCYVYICAIHFIHRTMCTLSCALHVERYQTYIEKIYFWCVRTLVKLDNLHILIQNLKYCLLFIVYTAVQSAFLDLYVRVTTHGKSVKLIYNKWHIYLEARL